MDSACTGQPGFSLSTLAQHNGFEQKPVRLTVINSAYQLVLILGWPSREALRALGSLRR